MGPEAVDVEDVVTGQLLAVAGHRLAADDADVVRRQLLLGRVRVQVVHVADGATRQDDVTQRFLERPTNTYMIRYTIDEMARTRSCKFVTPT